MAELARGSVTDRPWGLTFATLGMRGLTGQLDLFADGKTYSVAFTRGVIVAAASPLAGDSAIRMAMTANLVTSSQVNDLTRRMAAARGRDEVDLLIELAKLPSEHAQRLRRRLVAQRAARTFSIDRGDFVVVDQITLPEVAGGELDVRTIVYLGARGNLAEGRLATELQQMGSWFRLKREVVADLPQFGFTEAEKPILERIVRGGNLVDLVGDPELDPRTMRTVLYALASCSACELSASARSSEPPRPTMESDAPTAVRRDPIAPDDIPTQPRVPTGSPLRAVPPEPARAQNSTAIPVTATKTPSGAIPRQKTPTAPPAARAKASTTASQETEKLIASMLPLLERGADHFELLGVSQDASPEAVRSSYFNLARKLHPDRLASLGIDDPKRGAQRLFAQINTAFGVLSDPNRRQEYIELAQRGGVSAVQEEEARVEELAMRTIRAEESFKQGEMALRRGQVPQAIASFTQAVELDPNESEYQALLAWAKFTAAPDKNAVAGATRTVLQRAADNATRTPTARFYLGRVERMLGREREALAHFQEVVQMKPGHTEASSEIRLLEQRLRGKR
jgi:DnaJ-domain-containing protein 1